MSKRSSVLTASEVVSVETPQNSWYAWIYKLDSLGIETRGIERVPPEERRQKSVSPVRQFTEVMGLWFAACGGLTSMSSFFLPTLVFRLNLKDSLVSGIIGMLVGCLVPAYCSTMGPKSGCRQIVGARSLFGPWGVKFVALICIVGGIGWSVVNCVLGGQVLAGINSRVPLVVGIIIIAVASMVVAIFGIRVLYKFQTATSFPMAVASILFYVVVCRKTKYLGAANDAIAAENMSSITNRGNWLSFFTIGYSVTATWGSGASDYYILFPEETKSWKIFMVTFLGIAVPTTFVAVPATLCGTIAQGYGPWNDAYNSAGVGGLICEAFKPWGRFGSFVVVLFYISLVCNNIMNTYSVAFEFQLIDYRLEKIPRWCWAILITAIYLVISIVGKEHFSTIISNFLPMLGYWISIYICLLLEENLLFRTWSKTRALFSDLPAGHLYNWENWNQPHRITPGLAATIAFVCGAVGAVVGMNQVYWRGPIASHIGQFGGDVGFWLCGAFAAVAYLPARYLEICRFAR